MTGCRIGKVRYKDGTVTLPFKHLREVRKSSSFETLDRLNAYAIEGRISAIAVSVVLDGGHVWNKMEKADAIWNSTVLGAVESLRHDIVKDWCK